MRVTFLSMRHGAARALESRGVPPPLRLGDGAERAVAPDGRGRRSRWRGPVGGDARARSEVARAAAAWPAVLLAGLLISVGAMLVPPPSRGSLLAAGVVLLCVAVEMLASRRSGASRASASSVGGETTRRPRGTPRRRWSTSIGAPARAWLRAGVRRR